MEHSGSSAELPRFTTADPSSRPLPPFDQFPALLWSTDRDLRFTWFSGSALRATGFHGAPLLKQSVSALFGSREISPKAEAAHRSALNGNSASFETSLAGRDFHVQLTPLRSQDGVISGVIGVAIDLTARIVGERALRISEHSHRTLIEEAPYAICRATATGQLLQVNRAMLDMLGYSPEAEEELLIRDLAFIFADPEHFVSFRADLLAGNSSRAIESVWVRRDNRKIQVHVSGRAVRDPSGRVLSIDVLAEDVTERKQLEIQLAQAQKMQAIGQLAGGVAHDFNNLLTVIGGQIELLLDDPCDPESRSRLEEVKQAAQRAASLTRQLLAFSRRQVLQTKVIDINSVVQQVSGMLRRLINENIELTVRAGSDLGPVRADPNQIEQVLINLAVNARDAMPHGGRLIIETSNSDGPGDTPQAGATPLGSVRIAVRDTGVGMDAVTQSRIFEPFFTTKEAGQGTGLGLSLVYGVVRQSGGQISVKSAPGEGTTFHIYLPRVVEPREAEESPPIKFVSAGHETILLAEDEASVLALVSTYLSALGYDVLQARDGQQAMEVAATCSSEIHLLMSDLVMPRMGGRTLATEIQKLHPRVKVLFMSGYAGHEASAGELQLSAEEFLAKPFTLDQLATAVRRVLDQTGTSSGSDLQPAQSA